VRIVSIGEILWDVIGPSEYLGGAPLNFAAHAAKLGYEVFLVSAVGDDDRGRRALEGLQTCGVSADFVQITPGKPTGTAEVELDPDGRPMFRIVRPAAYDFVRLTLPIRQPRPSTQLDLLWHAVSRLQSGPGIDAPAAGRGSLRPNVLRRESSGRQLEPGNGRAVGIARQCHQAK
jgi:sugar/nucleoside kinase (ribokinase family)